MGVILGRTVRIKPAGRDPPPQNLKRLRVRGTSHLGFCKLELTSAVTCPLTPVRIDGTIGMVASLDLCIDDVSV